MMRFSQASGLLALISLSYAFPAAMWEAIEADAEIKERAWAILEERKDTSSADDAALVFENPPMFNEADQFIDVSLGSGREWVAPGPSDLRGPCPGLNAFANHNFLPHNGYATIQQFIDVTKKVVGMGTGLASFLAVYGAVIDGDLTAWSIGGTPPDDFLATPPIGGKGNGLSGSHNKYESDASPTRPDLYQYGNDYKVRVQQFQQLIDLSPPPAGITIPTLTKFRAKRFNTQLAQNKYFFNGPFTGVLVQPAAYTFIYRFMANHSADFPEGHLSRRVIKSWFSITGSDNNYKWVPGHERIPENWYRRALAYPYDQSYFFADVANAAKLYPIFLDVGGNTGTKNSFTGVNIANLSGGIINGQNLLDGDKFACLAYQFAANAKPDVALNSLAQLNNAIAPLASAINCPQLKKIDDSQLQQFPGYTRSPAA